MPRASPHTYPLLHGDSACYLSLPPTRSHPDALLTRRTIVQIQAAESLIEHLAELKQTAASANFRALNEGVEESKRKLQESSDDIDQSLDDLMAETIETLRHLDGLLKPSWNAASLVDDLMLE